VLVHYNVGYSVYWSLGDNANKLATRFLAFGVGLDPRQALVFGPQLGPILVGMTLGLVSFATTGTAGGFTGANMNPARCFAFAVARGSFERTCFKFFFSLLFSPFGIRCSKQILVIYNLH
jgi:glycerol uptake facilitator-like aquaporin